MIFNQSPNGGVLAWEPTGGAGWLEVNKYIKELTFHCFVLYDMYIFIFLLLWLNPIEFPLEDLTVEYVYILDLIFSVL